MSNLRFKKDGRLCSEYKDKHRKLIYEGDILKVLQGETYYIIEIYWDEKNVALRGRTKDGIKGFFPFEEPEIIGNIKDNPGVFV